MNELKGKRILFFVPESNIQTNAVHASQVGGLAAYAATLGAEVLVFQAATTLTERSYELHPHVRVLNDLQPRPRVLFFNVPRLYRKLAEKYEVELADFRPTHIYTRNHMTCYGARKLANETGAKLIFSVRGPAAEERRREGGLKNVLASFVTKLQEDAAMRQCDVLSTLSRKYADYLAKTYGRSIVGVIPCCTTERFFKPIADNERLALRKEFGFDDKHRVVVWSGSFAHWQCLDRLVQVMKEVCTLAPSYRILFLVKKERELMQLCRSAQFDEKYWRTKYCPSSEVPRYLQCADLGINLQDPNTLHSQTCSPIKIPEYLASGLPVLVSSVMGDMPEIVEREGVGKTLPDDLDAQRTLSLMEGFRDFERSRAISCARNLFLWDGNAGEIVKLFST